MAQKKMTLYICESPNNLLDKTKYLGVNTGGGTSYPNKEINISIKENNSVENPHITLTSFDGLFAYNYCYVNEYGRYYFIDDYITLPQGQVELVLREDYLMSFKEAIKNQVVHEERATNGQSSFLVDNEIAVQTNAKITKVYNIDFPELLDNSNELQYIFRFTNDGQGLGGSTRTGDAIGLYAKIMYNIYKKYLEEKAQKWNSANFLNNHEISYGIHYSQLRNEDNYRREDGVVWTGSGVYGQGYLKYPFPYTRFDTSKNGFMYNKTNGNFSLTPTGGEVAYDNDWIQIKEDTFAYEGTIYNSGLWEVNSTLIDGISDLATKAPYIDNTMTWWSFDCTSFAWRCCKFGYKLFPGTDAKSVDINSESPARENSGLDCGDTGSQLCFLLNHGCEVSGNELMPGDLIYWGPENTQEGTKFIRKVLRNGEYKWVTSPGPGEQVYEIIALTHAQVYIGGGQTVGAESESQKMHKANSKHANRYATGGGLCLRESIHFEASKEKDADYMVYNGFTTPYRATFVRPSKLLT